jgi:hypothetical protein
MLKRTTSVKFEATSPYTHAHTHIHTHTRTLRANTRALLALLCSFVTSSSKLLDTTTKGAREEKKGAGAGHKLEVLESVRSSKAWSSKA